MLCVPPGDNPSNSLYLSDIKPGIFLAVLEFIYTNCCSLSTHMVIVTVLPFVDVKL